MVSAFIKSKNYSKKSLGGIYVLIIQVNEDIDVDVGALGKRIFNKGLYAYVGSAQRNMEQRINRHLRSEKRKFWHIDYFLENSHTNIIKIFFNEGDNEEECKTAESLSEYEEPISGFGCSNCRCKSHLFSLKKYSFLQETMKVFPIET